MTVISPGSETDAVAAIWRLQSRYADTVSRRAWAELHDLFLPDTTVHLDTVTSPPRAITGPDAFGAFVSEAIARFDHFTFVILNTVVEVERTEEGAAGNRATGRIFMCEIRHDRASDTWQNAHGVYQDEYRFGEGGWRFARRHYRSLARTGPEGVVLGLPEGWPAGG